METALSLMSLRQIDPARIKTVDQVYVVFLKFNLEAGLDFHPDTSMKDYIDRQTGLPSVGGMAVHFDSIVQRCFEVCEFERCDIYDIVAAVNAMLEAETDLASRLVKASFIVDHPILDTLKCEGYYDSSKPHSYQAPYFEKPSVQQIFEHINKERKGLVEWNDDESLRFNPLVNDITTIAPIVLNQQDREVKLWQLGLGWSWGICSAG